MPRCLANAGFIGLLVFGGVACVDDLPEEFLVDDLRILEVRVDPPEISVFEESPVVTRPEDIPGLADLNREPVRIRVLAAHPDLSARFDTVWFRCRFDEDDGRPIAEQSPGFYSVPCPPVPEGTEVFETRTGTDAYSTAFVSPVTALVDDDAFLNAPDLPTAFGGLIDDPRDIFNGILAFLNVRTRVASARVPTDTSLLEARKRLVIYDRTLISLALSEARGLSVGDLPFTIEGIELPSLCTETTDEELGALFSFLETREPNRAPTYENIEFALPDDPDPVRSSTVCLYRLNPAARPLEIGPSEQIALIGRAGPEDLEAFRVIDDNCRLVDQTEVLSWSWFTNAGDLSRQLTRLERNDSDLRTTYTAPSASEVLEAGPAGLRVRIWSVLRDNRGASRSRTFEIVVTNDPDRAGTFAERCVPRPSPTGR